MFTSFNRMFAIIYCCSVRSKGKGDLQNLRLLATLFMLFLLILTLPAFVAQVEGGTSTNTLYAHAETTTIGGVNYYLFKLSSADGPQQNLSSRRKLLVES